MKTLNEDLKKRKFKNVYLLYGSEGYLRKQYRDRLRDAMIAQGDVMNLNCFSGKDIDVQNIMTLADTMPFFSDYRMIIVEESGLFGESASDELVDYMKHIPETSCLIFVETKVDKRNRLFKAVVANGYAANLTIPNDKQLMLWLAGMIKRENKQIQEQTLQYFLQIVEHDMNSLNLEMEKLICYVGERSAILKEDVDAVCSVSAENKIFDMINAIAEKNTEKALKYYGDLVKLREAYLRMLFLIVRQFDMMYRVRELAVQGYPVSAITEKTGIQDFIVKRNIALGRHFELDVLRQIVEEGTELEEDVKSGRIDDRVAVEMMILKYSR